MDILKTIFLLSWFLLLLPVAVLGAEMSDELVRALEAAGFSADQVSRVENIVDSASKNGVSVDVVTGKVYEGIAKKVTPERIVTALEKVTSRYTYGYTLARKIDRERQRAVALGNIMAAALAAGMSRRDAEKLVAVLRARAAELDSEELYRLAEEAMLTARDMSRQGVESTTTTEVVERAVQQGFSADDMQNLRSAFNSRAVRGGQESLARAFGTAIEHGAGPQDLSSVSSRGTGAGSAGTTGGMGAGSSGVGGSAGSGSGGGGGGRR